MSKTAIGFINSVLCKKEILSVLLLVLTCSIAAQLPKPLKKDSLILKQKDIIDVMPNKIKTRLRKDSLVQNRKRISFDIIPLDHQYWATFNTNIVFNKLKLNLSGTTRYANTYGIGSNTFLADTLPIQFSYLRVNQILFRKLVPNLFFGIGYHFDYHWNIITNIDRTFSGFDKLKNGSSSISSSISVNAKFDNRKNAINPQNGTYINLQYRPNLTMLGSNNDWQSLSVDIRHYFRLPEYSRNVLVLWNYYNITLDGNPPYLDLPSIGWDDYSNTGRGYFPGRFTGRNLVYFESEYRFPLTSNGLLGGVVFGNVGSTLRNVSSSLHLVIPGGGAGLRIKMNKNSNTNIALDFGFGVDGSWSFSFNLGEAF